MKRDLPYVLYCMAVVVAIIGSSTSTACEIVLALLALREFAQFSFKALWMKFVAATCLAQIGWLCFQLVVSIHWL